MGDDIQAIKAGLLEIADLHVVNKADRPEADRTVSELRTMLSLQPTGDWEPPILETVARDGTGLPELADAFDTHLAWLRDSGRAEYRYATDDRVMEAFRLLCRTEGIIPAIESAHALVGAMEVGEELGPDGLLLVNLSGRGDKDMHTAAEYFGLVEGSS